MKIVVATGKRKTAIAKALVKPGKGRVFINGIPLEIYPNELFKQKVMEPLLLAGREIWFNIDIYVNVRGGGVIGQADAVRFAIARALVAFFPETNLKKVYKEYDRTLLAGDPRQTEPEKYMHYSARRAWQKSYR
jgi:small subunit ribosomal protein S9